MVEIGAGRAAGQLETALYLAHLNPLTDAHAEIIRELREAAGRVVVMPVLFLKGGAEVNSRSFPFGFGARRRMVEAVFGGSVEVSRSYAFSAPFSSYMPPLLSPRSWGLRRQILAGVGGGYFTYTGDRAEWLMLKLYRLRPRLGRRKALSATSVKAMLYDAARGGGDGWRRLVPGPVASVIEEEWASVERYADAADDSARVAGMKFPRDGYR